MAIFGVLHKCKLIFHAYDVDIQNFYEFTI